MRRALAEPYNRVVLPDVLRPEHIVGEKGAQGILFINPDLIAEQIPVADLELFDTAADMAKNRRYFPASSS